MGEAFRKAISREAHTYQGVVYDIELCDEGGECASLVTRVGAGEIVDWRESRRGMVEVALGATSLYLPRWYFDGKFQELPELKLGQRYLSKNEFLELAPSGYDAYIFADGEIVHVSGQAVRLDIATYGQAWVAVRESAVMVTPVTQLGQGVSEATGAPILDGMDGRQSR